MKNRWPSTREAITLIACLVAWLVVTALFVGFRLEHSLLAILIAALFFAAPATRRVAVALLPFLIFGISYDWMNMLPNYKVNPVDIQELYENEKTLFGITVVSGIKITPNEYFAMHNWPVLDFFAGFFYLCWVPVPIAFGLWLYFKNQRKAYLHFALVFLLVNLLGFVLYYVHPAAPPWYVASHGFEFIEGTPGQVAGLARFADVTGWNVFDGLYARNANVFAAMPSLHSAYMLVALIYSLRSNTPWWMRIAFAVICVGIWFTAVYTSHHYILDVLAGVALTIVGYVIFEHILMPFPRFSRFMKRYVRYISVPKS